MFKHRCCFVDLTDAYGTVLKYGLIRKLYKTIPCKQIIRLKQVVK